MQESSTTKPFNGVRFLLSGFDSPNEEQVRSKLVRGGGDESEDYTHLVVDNTVYDDPVCVSARVNGKMVVTGLWVEHCFKIGLTVDPTSVMYQPPKDFNGIPGAKNLVVCLTGYQRQDRDDVMTMVSLMGAQFSRQLIAIKVTHLVCYKFEGELFVSSVNGTVGDELRFFSCSLSVLRGDKYELARKMKKIKLVNHRWLEDCLRNWKLLPEEEYNKR
ncbi:BRCT domain-containing protein At4g02110 [Linum perenne]